MNEISIEDVFQVVLKAKRSEITAAIYSWAGGRVHSGPFRGMRILQKSSWGDGDTCSKILGVYESELHPCVDLWTRIQPDTVVNIGCAEGYYAVGLARILPDAVVYAFDIAPAAQDLCRGNATLNQVQDRVVVNGPCSAKLLGEIVGKSGRTVVVCDCEGGELELLDPVTIPGLVHCDILVECHDFVERAITQTLIERFKGSHRIDVIPEGARDPNSFTVLRRMSSLERWLAMCEFRPEFMNWLFMRPRDATNA